MKNFPFTQKQRAEVSLGAAIAQLAGGGLTGFYRDFNQGCGEFLGVDVNSTTLHWPVQLMARDLTSADTLGSSNLVPQELLTAWDALRAWVGPVALGARVVELQGNASFPIVKTPITAGWLEAESTQLGESQPVIGERTFLPKNVGAYVEMSRKLLQQSSQVEALMRAQMMSTMGTELVAAIIEGSGVSGQPLGLVGTAEVGSVSGSTLALSGLLEAERLVSVAGGEVSGYLGAPDVRKTLGGREAAPGSGFLWSNGAVLGKPAHANGAITAGTLVAGQWDQLVIGIWGGIEISVNPYQGFRTGIVSMRVMMTMDFAAMTPGAFVTSTSIT